MVNKLIYLQEKGILTFLTFVFCLAVIPFLSLRLQALPPLTAERILIVAPDEYLKNIKGGFRNLLADAYYIRGVLAITDEFESRQERIDWIQAVFKASVLLDPDMLQAYFFAGSAIVNSKAELKKGNQFLEEGLVVSPGYWQIPYWIGFNHYLLGDYLKAAEYYRRASKLEGAPNYLKSNQPMLYYRAGEPRLGLMYLEGLLRSVNDPDQLKWLKLKIEWLKNIVILQDAVEQFRQSHKRLPAGLEELLEKGLIAEIPEDPFGSGYYLGTESGKIRSYMGGGPKPESLKNKDEVSKSRSSCSK